MKSKKAEILRQYRGGIPEIAIIADSVKVRPSYVARVLQEAGLIQGHFDLYTLSTGGQSIYGRHFRNVLSFKSVEAAKASVEQIARLYSYFERIGDRAGQHHAEVLALTGRNRARWSGKKEEAAIFEHWLFNH